MQNQMPIAQAIDLIDRALAQLNANRETHALLQTALARIQGEIEIGRALQLQGEITGSGGREQAANDEDVSANPRLS